MVPIACSGKNDHGSGIGRSTKALGGSQNYLLNLVTSQPAQE
jgi:hypothetical protein